jgi:hypothetical protein
MSELELLEGIYTSARVLICWVVVLVGVQIWACYQRGRK